MSSGVFLGRFPSALIYYQPFLESLFLRPPPASNSQSELRTRKRAFSHCPVWGGPHSEQNPPHHKPPTLGPSCSERRLIKALAGHLYPQLPCRLGCEAGGGVRNGSGRKPRALLSWKTANESPPWGKQSKGWGRGDLQRTKTEGRLEITGRA